jgi:5-methylcytosine-specific restriction protein A
MPFCPKRQCSHPGCQTLVSDRFCDLHLKAQRKSDDRHRGSAAERGYDWEWQKYSQWRLRQHPLCVDPYGFHKGRPTEARLTDHITPHKGDTTLFWDEDNHQSLCDYCHNHKTATEDGGFGRNSKTG